MKDLSLSVLNNPKPTKRGKVTRFTNASRRRMIDLAARLDIRGTNAKFVTLTFSGYPTPRQARIVLTKFFKRLHRRYPRASALWRAEMQKRGSPHFHLIIFNMPYIEQKKLQLLWEGCTEETKHAEYFKRVSVLPVRDNVMKRRYRRYVKRSRVDIRRLRNHKMVMYYVSKYCAKRPTLLDNGSYLTDFEMEWTGRHWGVFNRDTFPMAKREVGIIRDEKIFKSFRETVNAITHGASKNSVMGAKYYTSAASGIYKYMQFLSNASLISDVLEPDNRYMNSRQTRSRIERFFHGTLPERRAMNARKGREASKKHKALS